MKENPSGGKWALLQALGPKEFGNPQAGAIAKEDLEHGRVAFRSPDGLTQYPFGPVALKTFPTVFKYFPLLDHPSEKDMPAFEGRPTEMTGEFRMPEQGELFLTGGMNAIDQFGVKKCNGGWSINNGLRWICKLKEPVVRRFLVSVNDLKLVNCTSSTGDLIDGISFDGEKVSYEEVMEDVEL